MAGHETFQQGTIHAVKIAGGVGNIEQRLEVEMQRRMSKRREVDEGRVAVADCSARARLTATVVAPLPPLALTTEKTFPRGPSFEPGAGRW
jgi:hypothetical protein